MVILQQFENKKFAKISVKIVLVLLQNLHFNIHVPKEANITMQI